MDLGHRKLSSKHSKTHEGKESASVQMHGETFDHSIKDKKAKKQSKTTDDHLSCNDSSNESGSSSDSGGQIDVISKGEHDKNNHSDKHINGTTSLAFSTRRTSSSSSSESCSDDFFRMEEAFKKTKSEKDYGSSSESSDKSEVHNNLTVATSAYQVYNLSRSQNSISPTASPPIQVMDRSGTYDASIIPSSIFEGNTNPSEWSIASNDSLFSIQVGQPSFSRETAFMFGELGSSGDLTKSDELNNQDSSVILEETDTAKSINVEDLQPTKTQDLQPTETSYESLKLAVGERVSEENNETKTTDQNASYKSSKSNASILSHSSDNDIIPDALPVKKRSRKLAYCYNCRWVFCYLWPSSEGLKCCSAFSCCWNRTRTKHRHRPSQILSEAEKNDSIKMDIPRQQLDKLEPEVIRDSTSSSCSCFQSKPEYEVTSNASDKCCNWFHCVACPSCCTWKLSCTSCNCCC